jgi:hypothetical protein
MRLFNLDRNACNILVQEHLDEATGEVARRLVPIDHGLTMPDSLEIMSYDLAWLQFDQAYEPFSEKSLDYIKRLKIDEDIAFLEKNFKIRPECLRNMKISTLLLKEGARSGLTLADIGQVLCRPDDDDTQPSLLEKIVNKAHLIANMRNKVESKKQASILTWEPLARKDSSDKQNRPAPIEIKNVRKGIIKNNSFDGNSSPLKPALAAALGATYIHNDDDESPTRVPRQRGMTEGVDEHQINLGIETTRDMIKTGVSKLQK